MRKIYKTKSKDFACTKAQDLLLNNNNKIKINWKGCA